MNIFWAQTSPAYLFYFLRRSPGLIPNISFPRTVSIKKKKSFPGTESLLLNLYSSQMAMRHIHYFICIRFSLLLKETNHISPRSKNSTHFKIDMKNQNRTDIVRLIRQIFQTKVYLFLFFILQVKIMNFLSL